MRILAALILSALLGVLSSGSEAAGLPLVISATVDYAHNTLTISGQNFGISPAVTLDSLGFIPQSSSGSQIVANFPSGKAPASFTPGTYFLTVTFKNQLPTIFGVDIGANGAVGPAGPAGAQGSPGLPGAAGATGPAGPAGPQGIVGPMGPVGATGPAGPTGTAGAAGLAGATGATGAAGPQGLAGVQGSTGPQGLQGSPGLSSVVGIACPNSNTTLINGRYIDCSDGTLIDTTTQLMWEKATICGAQDFSNPLCFENTYTWSGASFGTTNVNDGTLFTDFLARLNGVIASGNGLQQLGLYRNWRIPSSAELNSILNAAVAGCNNFLPCIDAAFGPTKANFYWSSSSFPANPLSVAWTVNFFVGVVELGGNNQAANSARAVRGGR
jgi:hypothetical protein